MQLLNERGQIVQLTRPLTRAGGEGQVFEIDNSPGMVAKIYHNPVNHQKAEKLRYQIHSAKSELRSIAAWPTQILMDRTNTNVVRGIVMPKIAGKEIHKLYGPADRQADFPSVGWDYLVHVAMNCAAAFETLHEHGVVMADVNEGNLLVSERDGKVGLIDCDSYQIANGGTVYLCDVGIPMWTPPELQKQNFRGLQRTANHDRFGLAVIIFRLLFMGRHPFAGIPTGNEQIQIEEAIIRFLFAFSPKSWSRGVKPPPMSLPLAVIPDRMVKLFERAFLSESVKPNARPSGREWANELKSLLSAVKKGCMDPGHKYWNGLTSCPWCEIVNAGGPNFFISVSFAAGASNLSSEFSAFWVVIERVLQGPLMSEQVVVPTVIRPAPRPMLLRPVMPAISIPAMPEKPVPLSKPIVPSPILPGRPTKKAPKAITKIPLGPNERLARVSALGACFFGLAIVFGLQLESRLVVFSAASGVLLCVSLAISKARLARQERDSRFRTESSARENENRIAEEDYAHRLTEHETRVEELTRQHAMEVARVEANYQIHWQKQDQEYQRKYNVYLEAMRQYEAARKKYEEEEGRWIAEYNARRENERETCQQLSKTEKALRELLENYQNQVRTEYRSLEQVRQKFEKAKIDEIADMRKLHQRRQEMQQQQFLKAQLIQNAQIPKIGPVKKSTLVAYGYGSAWDIRPDMKVPGFGYTLIRSLLAWRSYCETQFRYNPNAPLPIAEVRTVKIRHAQARQTALTEMRSAAAKLENLEAQVRGGVSRSKLELLEMARAHAQARADFEACA